MKSLAGGLLEETTMTSSKRKGKLNTQSRLGEVKKVFGWESVGGKREGGKRIGEKSVGC